jgi:sterile alpha motif and leucine zipper-containing kinase AZK
MAHDEDWSRKVHEMERHVELTERQLELAKEQQAELQEKYAACALHENQIELTDKLGAGSFGDVWHGVLAGVEVAVKVIGKHHMDETSLLKFKDEIQMMAGIKHENVINFFGAVWEAPAFWLVLEYANGGSLKSALAESATEGALRPHKLALASDVADAFVYLHAFDPPVIHRDLKGDNVLLVRTPLQSPGAGSGAAATAGDAWRAKVADFGEARDLGDETQTTTGTPFWMAPEIVDYEHYTEKCDVYSFAVMLLEAWVPESPHKNISTAWGAALGDRYDTHVGGHAAMYQAHEGKRPDISWLTAEGQLPWRRMLGKLIKDCWHADPSPSL